MWPQNYRITCRLIRVTSLYGKSNCSLFQIEIRQQKRSKHLICRHQAPILKKQKFLPKISRNLKNNVTLIITRKLSFKIVNLKKIGENGCKNRRQNFKNSRKIFFYFQINFSFYIKQVHFHQKSKKDFTTQLIWVVVLVSNPFDRWCTSVNISGIQNLLIV